MFSCDLNAKTSLKILTLDDAPALFELTDQNRDHLRVWLPWVDKNQTVEDSRNFIKSTLVQLSHDNGFQAGIWFEGRLAGVVGHHAVNRAHDYTTLGYWLGEDFQGYGIMTLAVKEFTRYSFAVMKMNRVEIRCAVSNEKSRAIPERLGYKLEGELRAMEKLPQGFVNHAVYSVLADEFLI